jgi:hypothetical protein
MEKNNKIDWAWISRNLNLVMFIAIIVLILLLLQKCNGNAHLKQAVANGKQNQKALLDSLRQVKNRAGELQAEKLTLIATAKELELLNKGLYDEVKKQKGTGGARAGSIKSGTIVGGGRIFGPRPRNYSFKLNIKLKRLARKSAFAYKAQNDGLVVLEDVNFDSIKTKIRANVIRKK